MQANGIRAIRNYRDWNLEQNTKRLSNSAGQRAFLEGIE